MGHCGVQETTFSIGFHAVLAKRRILRVLANCSVATLGGERQPKEKGRISQPIFLSPLLFASDSR